MYFPPQNPKNWPRARRLSRQWACWGAGTLSAGADPRLEGSDEVFGNLF